MNSIRDAFKNIQNPGSQRNLDPAHPLHFYYGITVQGEKEFMLVSPSRPPSCSSTGSIQVETTVREDKRYVLDFLLKDNAYSEMFYSFCEDIVEYTRSLKNESEGARLVVKRYKDWQKMLRVGTLGPLSDEGIKGLVGELYYLKNYLEPAIGLAAAINAWDGPDGADQDFRLNNSWIEIKTTSPGKDEVRISSVEQLDSKEKGELVVLFADKTSEADSEGKSLFDLFKSIDEQIKNTCDADVEERFFYLLGRKNFVPSEIYDQPKFKFEGISKYRVGQNFPCIRAENLPDSVSGLSYYLILSTLSAFEIK